jgi:hypothetical protein
VGSLLGSKLDAVGEAASNQERLRAELLRGRTIPRLYLLVEGSWIGLERHLVETRRRVSMHAIFGLIASLDVSYGIRVVWAEDEVRASWFTGFVLNYIHEQHTDPKAAKKAVERGCGDLPWLRKGEINGDG